MSWNTHKGGVHITRNLQIRTNTIHSEKRMRKLTITFTISYPYFTIVSILLYIKERVRKIMSMAIATTTIIGILLPTPASHTVHTLLPQYPALSSPPLLWDRQHPLFPVYHPSRLHSKHYMSNTLQLISPIFLNQWYPKLTLLHRNP